MDFIRSYYFHHRRPSPITRWVGSCINRFEACSAFTHVMACTLAESPSDPLHRKLRPLRYLCSRFGCYRVERTSSRAGVAPAEVQCLFTAHVQRRCYADDSGIYQQRVHLMFFSPLQFLALEQTLGTFGFFWLLLSSSLLSSHSAAILRGTEVIRAT